MPTPRRIVLFGNSIFIAGIETCLRGQANLDLVRVDDRSPEAEQALRMLAADTIVFDASSDLPPYLMPLLQSSLNLVLIGVDPSEDSARVFSSRQPLISTMRDLAQIILHP